MEEAIIAKNRRTHTRALAMTKLGDGLLDPKIILAWLMTYVGAPTGLTALLVPLREAGALLPQLFTAAKLRAVPVRKWWWVWGSVVQAVAVLLIALAGLFLAGTIAGITIVAGVTLFALARSISSVSYKDVLGKTVPKPIRGVTTGTASSIAAIGVFLFGVLLLFTLVERATLVIGALLASVGLWLWAARIFAGLEESPSETIINDEASIWKTYWTYLKTDTELQKFLLVRGLLTATAVAPPFLLLLAESQTGELLLLLGALVVASSLATFVSGRVWGQLSDRSTSRVLSSCGFLGGIFLFLGAYAAVTNWYETFWFLPLLIFVFMVTYQGVRISRTIHLVNLADETTRAAYTAISNSIIGVVLLGTGIFGLIAQITSLTAVVLLLAVMSTLGGFFGLLLKD